MYSLISTNRVCFIDCSTKEIITRKKHSHVGHHQNLILNYNNEMDDESKSTVSPNRCRPLHGTGSFHSRIPGECVMLLEYFYNYQFSTLALSASEWDLQLPTYQTDHM